MLTRRFATKRAGESPSFYRTGVTFHSDYHARREGEHRALAEAAITAEAKRAHLGMADQHAARTRSVGSLPDKDQRRRATGR